MKKLMPLIAIMCLLLTFTGCAKLVSTEQEEVDVTVIGEYHRMSYYTPIKVRKTTTMIFHPAIYRITVEYEGATYTIDGKATYDKYADKIGGKTTGILEIRAYDDGKIRYDIIDLK